MTGCAKKSKALYSRHVDRQSSTLRPAFYTPANYLLSRTFLPKFISRFLRVGTSASRTSAFYQHLPLTSHDLWTFRPFVSSPTGRFALWCLDFN